MRSVRTRRSRSSRGPSKLHLEGFTAAELGAKVGVSARTVRYYTTQHVLPAPPFRGSATRYLREHLIHLAAVRYLQRERRYSLAAIRQHLNPLPLTELERLASFVLPELAPPPVPLAPAPTASESDAWHRLTLVTGLELHVHTAASEEAKALARRIVSQDWER